MDQCGIIIILNIGCLQIAGIYVQKYAINLILALYQKETWH